MITPKVSVIIPVYNTERYLGESVGSVINQTLRDIEIL
ncbi:MAG: glycosyltransferase, partial [Bacteroidales bacterium]|nr:glycosyltransferase [Bacteroidales bacterium]